MNPSRAFFGLRARVISAAIHSFSGRYSWRPRSVSLCPHPRTQEVKSSKERPSRGDIVSYAATALSAALFAVGSAEAGGGKKRGASASDDVPSPPLEPPLYISPESIDAAGYLKDRNGKVLTDEDIIDSFGIQKNWRPEYHAMLRGKKLEGLSVAGEEDGEEQHDEEDDDDASDQEDLPSGRQATYSFASIASRQLLVYYPVLNCVC